MGPVVYLAAGYFDTAQIVLVKSEIPTQIVHNKI